MVRNRRVDRVGRRLDREGGRPSASRQSHAHPPPILGVVPALEVLPEHKGVNQLTGCLLAQSERGHDVGLGAEPRFRRPVIQAGEHEDAVAGNVIEAGCGERASHGVSVHVACLTHQPWHWNLLGSRAIAHRGCRRRLRHGHTLRYARSIDCQEDGQSMVGTDFAQHPVGRRSAELASSGRRSCQVSSEYTIRAIAR